MKSMKDPYPFGFNAGRFFGLFIIVSVCGALTTGLFWIAHNDVNARLRGYFQSDAGIRSHLVIDELNQLLSRIEMLGRYVEGMQKINRAGFTDFVAPVLTGEYRGQTIQWVPRVMGKDRAVFEKSARSGGLEGFRFTELDRQGNLIPAKSRQVYYPIYYAEPAAGNEKVLGFDLGTDPERLQSFHKACDSGETVATGRIILSQGDVSPAGFLIFKPVYRQGLPVGTVEQRRVALTGFIVGVFRGYDVMSAAIEPTPPADMPTELLDVSAPEGKRLIHHWAPRLRSGQVGASFSRLYPLPLRYEHQFLFAGRQWRIDIVTGPVYLKRHYSLWHWLILPVGFLLTAILSLYLHAALTRQERAEALVEKRTGELRISEKNYRSLFEQSKEGLVICDLGGLIVDVNQATLDMTGYTSGEIKGRPYQDLIPEKWRDFDADLIRNQLFKRGYSEFHDREWIRKDGTLFPTSVRAWLLRDTEEDRAIGVTIWVQDISERNSLEEEARINQLRMESLLRISQGAFDSVQDLLDYALDESIKLTGSKIGYIYFYNDVSQEFTLNTWSKDVMKECSINEKKTLYQLDKTGIWGEAVRQAKPIILNDYQAPHLLKKGYPEGHASLHRFLTIPVFSKERIVAVVGVANKEANYSNSDVQQLTLLMHSIWQVAERRQMEQALQKERDLVQIYLDTAEVMLLVLDTNGKVTLINRKGCELTGYQETEIIGKNWFEVVIPQDQIPSAAGVFTRIIAGEAEPARYLESALLTKSGERRLFAWHNAVLRDEKGSIIGALSSGDDITERIQAQEALRQSEERFRVQFMGIPVPTYIWEHKDGDFFLIDYNDAALEFTRGRISGFKDISASRFYDGKAWITDDMHKCLAQRINIENKFWDTLRTTGQKKYMVVKYAFVPPNLVMVHMEDITLQKEAEEHLRYLSLHDPLTGLYNRLYADTEIERLKTSRKYPVSILMVDIDGLKAVNDSEGHAAGDRLIKNAAYILRQTFRPEDMVARIGGDEFLVILPSMDGISLEQSLNRMKVYKANFNASSPDVSVSFSTGSATAHTSEDLENCIKQADLVMYLEKAKLKALKAED